MFSQAKSKVLIIGDDILTYQDYWRYYSQATEYEIVGFIHPFWEEFQIKKFKGAYKNPITVAPLRRLEKLILTKGVQKCFLHVQNIEPGLVMSIINRILSTNICSFEILPNQNFNVKAFKPVITLSSLIEDSGKTSVARYILYLLKMHGKKVSIIIDYQKLPTEFSPNDAFVFSKLFHEEYSPNDEVPDGVYSRELTDRIRRYQKCNTNKIIVTSDLQKAVVSAEQSSDIIMHLSTDVNQPHIDAQIKFCVVPEQYLTRLNKVNWPGQRNFHDATHIIIIPSCNAPVSDETRANYREILSPKKVIFMWIHYSLDDENYINIFNKPIVAVGNKTQTMEAARQMGVSSCELVSNVAGINSSDAEIVMVTLPCDLTGVNEDKIIVNASREVDDRYNELANWTDEYCMIRPPALQVHFESQVDVLEAFAKASCNELRVQNNDSANRETFCRMFLSSHLPPGFRVTTGEIIDSHMNTTGQLDVVIVNDFCPSMTIAGDAVIGPILADNVLGVVEVKTTLTEDSLNKALSQLRSVRSLMPMHDSLETPDGSIVDDPLNGKVLTGIFAFNEVPGIDEKAFSIINEYPNVADFVVLPGCFAYFSLATLSVCEIAVSQNEVRNGYVRFGAKGMGLAMLYGLLNSIAAKRRFSGLNCLQYIQGNWGGKNEQVAKASIEVSNSLSKFGSLINKGEDPEVRNTFNKAVHEFVGKMPFTNHSMAKGRNSRANDN